ncbi:UNVERIFIED_ORG: hypothetical protein QQG_4007 [Clostridioides difficile Y384]|nr:hypothetical protein EfmE1679_0827 [Enterococcus faecium E1679]EFF29987.1 hypothetical protein EfmU0317_0942 [Enterococcus faecium U0317]
MKINEKTKTETIHAVLVFLFLFYQTKIPYLPFSPIRRPITSHSH